MKKKILPALPATILFVLVSLTVDVFGQNLPPQLQNASFSYKASKKEYTFKFDVADKENDRIEIRLAVSYDSGRSFSKAASLSAISPGKRIELKWKHDPTQSKVKYYFKLIADDHQPFDKNEIASRVILERMKKTYDAIYGERNIHSAKSLAKLDSVRSFISDYFEGADFILTESKGVQNESAFQNIIGDKVGTNGDSIIIVGAHYDTVEGSPGGDDNTSGVAALMELAKCLEGLQFKKTIRLIAFDAEEMGLVGSRHYVKSDLTEAGKVSAYFNYDMIGYFSEANNSQPFPEGMDALFPEAYKKVSADKFKGNFLLLMANNRSFPLATSFEKNANLYATGLKTLIINIPENGEMAPNIFRASDHASFWDAGVPALSIGDTGNVRNLNYHSAADIKSTISFKYIVQNLQATLATLADHAQIQHCHEVLLK